MKNRIFLLALAVFSLFISVNMGTQKAMATDPPSCDPCKEVISWTNAETFIQGPGFNCSWKVNYRFKQCGTEWYVELVDLSLLSTSTPCLISDEALMQMAIKKVLFLASLIPGTSSPVTIKLITPACVKRNLAGTSIAICPPINCCTREFKLNKVIDNIQIASRTISDPSVACSSSTGACANVCEIVDELPLNTNIEPMYSTYLHCGCEVPWSSDPSNFVTKTVGGCTITAYYETRICNGVTEVLIKYLTSSGSCSNLTVLMQHAIGKIIAQLGGPNPVMFRFRTCWETYSGDNLTYYSHCGAETCCSVLYNRRVGTVTSEGINCQPFTACEFICDSDFSSYESAKHSTETPLNLEGTKTFIVPNPSKGATDLHFISEYTGEVSVSIVDNLGNVVFEQQFTKDKSELIYNFDSSKLAKGAYHFYLSTGIIPLSSGSFIVE